MGIVGRQGIQNAFFSYTGIILGVVNKLVLFTHILGKEKMGLEAVILSAAVMLAEFSRLGSPTILLRFYPFFQKNKEAQKQLTFFTTLLYPLLGYLVFAVFILLFKDNFIHFYAVKAPLFVEYYYYVFPIWFGLMLFNGFYTFAQAQLKTVLPTALFEVGSKIFHTLAVLLFYFKWVNINGFLNIYCVAYLLNATILLIYLIWLKRYQISFSWSELKGKKMRIMMKYGFYSFLSRAAYVINENIAVLQIASLGLEITSVFSIANQMALMIYVPTRALSNITIPLVTKYLQSKDYKELAKLYQKASTNGLIFGSLLFVGIWVNIDDLFALIGKDFAEGKWIFFILACGRMIDVAHGLNVAIIVTSKYYRYNLYSIVLLMIMVVSFNAIFIEKLGGIGPGISSATAFFIYNSINTYLVWKKFQMQPFSFANIKTFLITLIAWFAAYLTPNLEVIWLNILLHSLITGGVFIGLLLYFEVSEDVMSMVKKLRRKTK